MKIKFEFLIFNFSECKLQGRHRVTWEYLNSPTPPSIWVRSPQDCPIDHRLFQESVVVLVAYGNASFFSLIVSIIFYCCSGCVSLTLSQVWIIYFLSSSLTPTHPSLYALSTLEQWALTQTLHYWGEASIFLKLLSPLYALDFFIQPSPPHSLLIPPHF